MFRRPCFVFFLLICITPFTSPHLYAQDEKNHTKCSHTETDKQVKKKIDFILRLGQGGFRDSRSPVGQLGGGQLALAIKPSTFPIALSISSEYYTNSPNPTHPYEISSMISVNMLYMSHLFNIERVNYFCGGGIGQLEVPKGENDPDASVKSNLYNLEAGINVRAFWKIGFYGAVKYLYAQKEEIDFNENIILLGVTINFSL